MLHRRSIFTLTLAILLAGAAVASAQFPGGPDSVGFPGDDGPNFGDSRDKVTVSVVPGFTKVTPGGDVPIAIIFDHAQSWHIHLNEIKDETGKLPWDIKSLIPTTIAATTDPATPIAVNNGFIQWPTIHEHNLGTKANPIPYNVFNGKAIAFLPVTVNPDAKLGKVTITFNVGYQACGKASPFDKAETCLAPASETFTVTLDVVSAETLAAAGQPTLKADVFGDFDASIWPRIHSGEKAAELVKFDLFGWSFEIDVSGTFGLLMLLLVAGVGGFLLNLTPCVLPVIPLKIMGLSQSAGNRAKCFMLGSVMSLGVVAFWVVLGLAIATVTGFTATNQLFQTPAFTIGVGVVIAVMAIGMCGLFAVKLPNWVYRINPKHDSVLGSFGFGVMTAVLSTPCTAPFMGSAAAWAATQTTFTTMLTFAAIGIGMAVPYMILSASPQLVQKMPRTGPASELIKQVMGLLMLAAAAYFVGVGISGLLQSPPEPASLLYWWPVMALIFAAGAWLLWRTIQLTKRPGRLAFFGLIGLFFMATGVLGGISFTDRGPIDWVYYTPQRFKEANEKGQVVVMDFTAEWCLNCKAIEKSVLYKDAISKLVKEADVVPMKVDLTKSYPEGNAILKDSGGIMIPWLVIYDADGKAVFRSSFYTVDQVVDAVNAARGKPVAKTP